MESSVNHNASIPCFVPSGALSESNPFNTSRVFLFMMRCGDEALPAALVVAITIINSLLPSVRLCRYRAPRLAITGTLVGMCSSTIPISSMFHMGAFISCKLFLSRTSFRATKYCPTCSLFIYLCLVVAVHSGLQRVNCPCLFFINCRHFCEGLPYMKAGWCSFWPNHWHISKIPYFRT